MAYPEKRGKGPRPWRVKYMTPEGERSRSGFATSKDALDWGRLQEAEVRAGRWRDPRSGRITVAEWIEAWAAAQDLAETTQQNYGYLIEHLILPRWGKAALADLTTRQITEWEVAARAKHKPSTPAKARSLLGTILEDAVQEGRLAVNPARKRRRRGRQDVHVDTSAEESLWATPSQVLAIAERVAILAGRWDEALQVLLAAYTGMRFGEVRGLERRYAHLGSVRVEWQLREVDGRFLKAPPKHNRRRVVQLPPFLTALMSEHVKSVEPRMCGCADHRGDYVFRPPTGNHYSRSNYANRLFRPAAGGRLVAKGPRRQYPIIVDGEGRQVVRQGRQTRSQLEARAVMSWLPVVDGLTFHDLKHSHKTWMIGDGVPEVLQFDRLGHKLSGIRGVYSHVDPEMVERLMVSLQARWEKSLRRRARLGPSKVPELQALLVPYLGPWEVSSQISPNPAGKIIQLRMARAV